MASYSKREDNSWSVRFRIISPEGKVINKRLSGFDKKSQAERAYREFMASYTAPVIIPTIIDRDSLTFVDVFNQFIIHKKSRVKAGYLYEITQVATKHLLPFFADMQIHKITKLEIYNWQTSLEQGERIYTHGTKVAIRNLLNSIFNHAMRYYDLPSNPIRLVENFRDQSAPKEMRIWTMSDFHKFIGVVDNLTYKALFTMLFYSGCRKGEALALNWADINFNTKKMKINKSIERHRPNCPFSVSTTKNKSSNREVLLPQNCIDLLQEHYSNSDMSSRFIFGGTAPIPAHVLQREFKRYCSIANVNIIRIHDFRHTHASILINSGANIVLIAKRLGHANIEQTLNTYSHLMPNTEHELVETLDREFVKCSRAVPN